mmetsp:Transcript_19539/g.44742  ORF Transcript_19539/g.44742 Transcript_19539/m.44742 type:complete len:357 (+) Transcript_19539:199-1269(+)
MSSRAAEGLRRPSESPTTWEPASAPTSTNCHAYFLGNRQFSLGREPDGSTCGCCDDLEVYNFRIGEGGGFDLISYPWKKNFFDCRGLIERMTLLPCSRMQGLYVKNSTLRICSSACDALFDMCGLPGENLLSSYNYTDGKSLCYNAWGGFNGSTTTCANEPDGALCRSGIVNIEVVDGDDCLGADSQYPHCDGYSDSSSASGSSMSGISRAITSYTRYIFWPVFVLLTLYSIWKQRKRIQRRREGGQDAADAATVTLPTASATPVGTVPEPATEIIPVASAVPEPPVTPVVQATAVAPADSAAANGTGSVRNAQVTAGNQPTFDQEMDIQSLEFKLRMEMITQEQFDEAKREIMNQ